MSGGVELRRHSSGKANAGNNEEKVVPHYLRASTGSCHDICKYGKKEASKANDRSSERKHLRHRSEEILGGIMISVSRRRASVDSKPTKVSVIKHRHLVDSKILSSDASETNEPELPMESFDNQRQIGNEVQISRNKTSLFKVNPSTLTKFRALSFPKIRRQESSSCFKVETSSKSTSKKDETPLKSTCERVHTHSESASKKMESSSKLSTSKVKETEFAEKHVISFNPKSGIMQTNASVNSEFKREASCKIASSLRASLSSSKPSVKRIESTNTRKHKSLKTVSRPKSQLKARKDEPKEHNHGVDEKTLYVIKLENEGQTLQSHQNACQDIESSLSCSLSPHKFTSSSISQPSSQKDTEESEYAATEFEEDSSSEIDESECIESEEKALEAEKNVKLQSFEDKECQVLKLKIIRRKSGETQNEKKGGPRRLKFREGKVWWNNGAENGSEKVFLRHHQNVKGKKDEQVLFNNMIEETTCKLVESKKNKVMALVGAFETVISLQEHKPFANNIVS